MTTSALRSAIKAIDPDARVSPTGDGVWTIRTRRKLKAIRSTLPGLDLVEMWRGDIEGSRWDWVHVLTVRER